MRILALLLLLTSLPVAAQRVVPASSSVGPTAAIAHTWPLVEHNNGESVLRVTLHLLGPIPATDVSPPYDLVLTMYALFPEWGTAEAEWRIDEVLNAEAPKRVAPGIYEISIRTFNPQQSMAMDCFIADQTLHIDARQASIVARASRPEEHFEVKLIEENIFVSSVSIACSENQEWSLY